MKFNRKQMELGLNLMESAEEIPCGFCWYNHDGNETKYQFKKGDFKKLKGYKKQLDKDYNLFIKSIRGDFK